MSNDTGVASVSLLRVSKNSRTDEQDLVVVEEPLEIRVAFGPAEQRSIRSLAITMRTPGHDFELVTGFLLAESVITSISDIDSIRHCSGGAGASQESEAGNVVRVELAPDIDVNFKALERHSFTSSSCGVCGKTSIEAVRSMLCQSVAEGGPEFNSQLICSLPATLDNAQAIFTRTGGLHATGIFTQKGELLLAREDVGRHNAMDKVFGAALYKGWLPLSEHIVLVSGRVSFEIVQKALMAGVSVLVAIGAPSSLAVDLAKEFGLTLIGFVSESSFNVYSGKRRLLTSKEG